MVQEFVGQVVVAPGICGRRQVKREGEEFLKQVVRLRVIVAMVPHYNLRGLRPFDTTRNRRVQ